MKPSTNPDVPNFVLKALYAVMLTEFPLEAVRGFWKHRLIKLGGSDFTEAGLYRRLWKEGGKFPLAFVYGTWDSLERFCVAHNINVVEVVDKMAMRVNRGSFLPGQLLLRWLKPMLPRLFKAVDPRLFLLKGLKIVGERYIPDSYHRTLRIEKLGAWTQAYVFYVADRSFSGRYSTDYDLVGGHISKLYPRTLGAPPMEVSLPLSDCRFVGKVLWQEDYRLHDGKLFIHGHEYGKVGRFYGHCARLRKELKALKVPDADVVVMGKDYICPLRKRVVLYGGCAYGAPGHVQIFRFGKLRHKPEAQPPLFVGRIGAEEQSLWKSIERIHLFLLEQVAGADGKTEKRGKS